MPDLKRLASAVQTRLDELVERLEVPGATVGISWNEQRVAAVAGVASVRSELPVTRGTVFQVGSISKVYTATLLAVLTGLDDKFLNTAVSELVPEARWMDDQITIEHLLTHSSGLGGDHFADTGRGDDVLARYVTELERLPRDFPGPPGVHYSYCNSGYSVLGRVIEVIADTNFDAALKHNLLDPLGAKATGTLPEDVILHPVAVGHNRHGEGGLTADERWNFARSCNPLGGVCASVDDLLAFAELHLADGRSGGGRQILSVEAAQRMRQRWLECPPFCSPSARGLGWGLFDWPGATLVGHNGETLGEIAKLRLLPEEGMAFAILTNGIPDGDRITVEIEELICREWGLRPPRIDMPPVPEDFDPSVYEGEYENVESVTTVRRDEHGRGLVITRAQRAEGLESEAETTSLRPVGNDAFADISEEHPRSAISFADVDPTDGKRQSLFYGRVAWRRG